MAPTVAMQGDAAAQAPPRDADLLEAFGPGPLLKRLLADRKQHSAAALVLGAHDMHAPLVACVSAAAAGQCRDPLDLFACLLVEDGVAEVDVADQARVRVVLILRCCVEGIAGWRYSGLVHSILTFLWAVPLGSLDPPAEASYVVKLAQEAGVSTETTEWRSMLPDVMSPAPRDAS
jgi:hypothetical protein